MKTVRLARLRKRESAGLSPQTPNAQRNSYATPGIVVWMLIGYAALFLIRPWEYRPQWAFFPWERAYGVLLLLVILVMGRPGNGWSRLSGTLILFFASLAIATAVAFDPIRSWRTTSATFKSGLFGFCLAWGLLRRKDLQIFVNGWIAIEFIYQAKSLWEHLLYGRGVYRMGIWRLVGIDDTYSDPNTFASTTVLLLPFVLESYRTTRSRTWRFFLLAETVLAIIVILKTGSRGGIVGLLLVVIYIVLRSKHRLRTFGVAFSLGAVVVAGLSAQLVTRYETIWNPDLSPTATESAQGRIEGLKRGLAIVTRRPLTGVGPGCFTDANIHLPGLPGIPGLQAHNIVGQALGETGILGTAAFLLFLGALVFRSRQALIDTRRTPDEILHCLSWAVVADILLLLVLGMVGHNLYRYNWFWLAGIMESAAALAHSTHEPRKSRRTHRDFTVRRKQ